MIDAEFARAVVQAAECGRVPDGLSTLLGPSPDPGVLDHCGVALLELGMDEDDPVFARAAAVLLARLVELTGDRWERAAQLTNLCLAHHEAHRCGGDRADLDHAVAAGERAVEVVDHPDRPVLLANLGIALRARHDRLHRPEDLARAVEVAQEALTALPGQHPYRARYLSNLASACTATARQTGRRADAERAVEHAAAAVAAGAEDPELAMYLHRLADAHFERHRLGGRATDLDEAVARDEEAAAKVFAEGPRSWVPALAGTLCVSYVHRFRRDGDPVDLDRAIGAGRAAIEGTGGGQPHFAARAANLGVAHQERYERTGQSADLDEAVAWGRRAVEASDDDPSLPRRLSDLAAAHHLRHDRDGAVADLNLAIDLGERAATAGEARALSNVALARWQRYRREEDRADLDRAVEAGEQAVSTADPGDSDLVAMRTNLGLALVSRADDTGSETDLQRAVHLARDAVSNTAEGHPDLPTYLSNLGNALVRLPADVDEAVSHAWRAVELTPDEHPRAAVRLANLANTLLRRHRSTGGRGEAREAADDTTPPAAGATAQEPSRGSTRHAVRDLAWDAAEVLARVDRVRDTCPPTDLVRLGHRAGALALAAGQDRPAVRLLDEAVDLLSSLVVGGARRVDQEYWLGEHRDLPGDAVAAHCAVGDAAGAVEIAEAGRGVLLSAALDTRAGPTKLDPASAARLREVGSLLRHVRDRAERARLRAEHDDLLDRAREAGFPARPRFADLRAAVAGGAAVLVNAGWHGGHAVVVTADAPPLLVELPLLRRAAADQRAEALLGATYDRGELGGGSGTVVAEVLEWLWHAVVGPVLAAVPLHRVWWLPVGVLGLFPLHAAGVPGQPGALDTVVSSYASTLRTLAWARHRRHAPQRRTLGVAVGAGLPAAAEVRAVADLPLVASEAVPERVLAELPRFTWAYFACHADVDLRAPSLSALHLHEADLPVSAIHELDLEHAELAYLSACSTGHRGVRHVNESINPASAFQLAGFRHVVAGMWPLNHSVAKRAARQFHHSIGDRADTAAQVLREVTLGLRDRYPDAPAAWAPLIHSGP
ncbi:CHAT domain-containing protein [Actinosynnema sp. CA-299493]